MKRIHPLLAPLIEDETIVYPALEAIDIQDAIHDAAELARVQHEGRQIREASAVTGKIQVGLESLHSMFSQINAQGGLSLEQYGLAELALESQCSRLEIRPISLGVSLEGFTEATSKQTVSLEEIEGLIAAVDGNHAALAQDTVETIDDSCEVLKSALPNCAQRLNAIIRRAESNTAVNDTAIQAGDIAGFLMNGDDFPEDFEAYMKRYVDLGKKIVGPFCTAVSKAAAKAADLKNVSFNSAAEFRSSSVAAFQDAVDPRETLTDDDYETCLPGDGPLFATDDEACVVSEEAYQGMAEYTYVNGPCDPEDFACDGDAPSELPALSSQEIISIGKALQGLVEECDAAQFQEDVAANSECIDGVIHAFTDAYDAAESSVIDEVNEVASLTLEHLGAIKTMAQWTPIYFMSNLVQTTNAFLVYAERSLGGSEMTNDEGGE